MASKMSASRRRSVQPSGLGSRNPALLPAPLSRLRIQEPRTAATLGQRVLLDIASPGAGDNAEYTSMPDITSTPSLRQSLSVEFGIINTAFSPSGTWPLEPAPASTPQPSQAQTFDHRPPFKTRPSFFGEHDEVGLNKPSSQHWGLERSPSGPTPIVTLKRRRRSSIPEQSSAEESNAEDVGELLGSRALGNWQQGLEREPEPIPGPGLKWRQVHENTVRSEFDLTEAAKRPRTRLSLGGRSRPAILEVGDSDREILQQAGLKPTLRLLGRTHGFNANVVAEVYKEQGSLKETEEVLKAMRQSANAVRDRRLGLKNPK